jgi:RimJ/RimL family protein N-acetyltransferase
MTPRLYPVVLFDWGDTVMKDDLASTVPMVEWPQVQAVGGIAEVLEYLQSSGRRCILATSASISDQEQIRAALGRARLDRYFERIYCFKNTGLPKGEAFYRHILEDLDIGASQAVMVGDGFEKDVLIPNALGMYALWFNPRSDERRKGEMHETVCSMQELLALFSSFDANDKMPPDKGISMLRNVIESDLPVFYEHQRDAEAAKMAAMPSRDRQAFMAHWEKILQNETIITRTIVFEGQVAGQMLSFIQEGKRQVGYWLGREFWGNGIASRALAEFLTQIKTRPLYAHVAKHNLGSLRVLEKCGFRIVDEAEGPSHIEGETAKDFVLELAGDGGAGKV